MKTLTTVEMVEWCKIRSIEVDASGRSTFENDLHCIRVNIPSEIRRLAWFSRFIESNLRPRDRCLVWVTSWGIWESSENWHLYYRLRQSYGDFRLIEEAPGHLFLEYETPDLISFLHLGLSAGWDMHLFLSDNVSRVVVSHDGWVEIALADKLEVARISAEIKKTGLSTALSD